MSLFCEINYKDLTNEIKETKYTEGNSESETSNKEKNKKKSNKKENNILDCILSKYDIEYDTSDKKDIYRENITIEIASKIDEESNKKQIYVKKSNKKSSII